MYPGLYAAQETLLHVGVWMHSRSGEAVGWVRRVLGRQLAVGCIELQKGLGGTGDARSTSQQREDTVDQAVMQLRLLALRIFSA